MGWRDDPLAQPGPVARPDPVARPGTPQKRPAWASDPVASPTPAAAPVSPPAATPEPAQPLSWSEVPGKALENAPGSALKLAEGLIQPILHPVDTAKGIFDIGYGLASKLHGALGGTQDPDAKAKDESAANAVGKHFAERYGSVDGFKKAIAEDPVGVMADVSVVLTGGGALASRAPGVIGKVGEVASAAGSAVDPLANAGRVAVAGGKTAANVLGMTTGAGTRPFVDAFEAGSQGRTAFADNMRGKVPQEAAVDLAESAVSKMGQKRSADYKAGIGDTTTSTAFVDPRPVFKKINAGLNMATFNGIPRSADAVNVTKSIDDVVTQFATSVPVGGKFTPELFDAMKQAVGEIRQKTQQGTLERRIADNVYHSIKDEIVKQVPSYAKAMKDYQTSSDLINEARRTLSVNDRATTDTTLRKLQSSKRDGVNANFGQRAKLVDELSQFEPDLSPALSGQTLNSIAPKGLARMVGNPLVAGAAAMQNPLSLAMLPLASPRLMGELTYGAGQVSGPVINALMRAGIDPATLRAAANTGYAVNALMRDQ